MKCTKWYVQLEVKDSRYSNPTMLWIMLTKSLSTFSVVWQKSTGKLLQTASLWQNKRLWGFLPRSSHWFAANRLVNIAELPQKPQLTLKSNIAESDKFMSMKLSPRSSRMLNVKYKKLWKPHICEVNSSGSNLLVWKLPNRAIPKYSLK